jgi:hypothetical protein
MVVEEETKMCHMWTLTGNISEKRRLSGFGQNNKCFVTLPSAAYSNTVSFTGTCGLLPILSRVF